MTRWDDHAVFAAGWVGNAKDPPLHARLPELVMASLSDHAQARGHWFFGSWLEAVERLALGLRRLREVVAV